MVATEIAKSIGLDNVTLRQCSIEEEKMKCDFAVSRGVMPLQDIIKLVRKNISSTHRNALPNGLLYLKGGDLQHEMQRLQKRGLEIELKKYFAEPFFATKKVVYVQI